MLGQVAYYISFEALVDTTTELLRLVTIVRLQHINVAILDSDDTTRGMRKVIKAFSIY